METVAIAALSLDGCMTRHGVEGNGFTSAVEEKHFSRVLKTFDCSVFGSLTFDAARNQIEGRLSADRLRIVLTSRKEDYAGNARSGMLEFHEGAPWDITSLLNERGKTRCALLGGARVFADFLQAGLIDEFWITYEPVFFGSGKRLLKGCLDWRLELTAVEELGASVIVAKYRPLVP